MQSNASYWGDSLRCGQTEVYFKIKEKIDKIAGWKCQTGKLVGPKNL